MERLRSNELSNHRKITIFKTFETIGLIYVFCNWNWYIDQKIQIDQPPVSLPHCKP